MYLHGGDGQCAGAAAEVVPGVSGFDPAVIIS